MKDHLVLLSLYQTCRYRGVSFLKFLLSRETDMDAFCERPRRRRRSPLIEVYPEGEGRPDYGPTVVEMAKVELLRLQGQWDLMSRSDTDGSLARCGDESGSSVGSPLTLTFNGDALAANADWRDAPNEFRSRCRLNPKRKPHYIDFVIPDAADPLDGRKITATPGIYGLEGDDLRICIPADGSGRPTSFEPGKGNWLYTLRRRR